MGGWFDFFKKFLPLRFRTHESRGDSNTSRNDLQSIRIIKTNCVSIYGKLEVIRRTSKSIILIYSEKI
jgi:hypothetical protein